MQFSTYTYFRYFFVFIQYCSPTIVPQESPKPLAYFPQSWISCDWIRFCQCYSSYPSPSYNLLQSEPNDLQIILWPKIFLAILGENIFEFILYFKLSEDKKFKFKYFIGWSQLGNP